MRPSWHFAWKLQQQNNLNGTRAQQKLEPGLPYHTDSSGAQHREMKLEILVVLSCELTPEHGIMRLVIAIGLQPKLRGKKKTFRSYKFPGRCVQGPVGKKTGQHSIFAVIHARRCCLWALSDAANLVRQPFKEMYFAVAAILSWLYALLLRYPIQSSEFLIHMLCISDGLVRKKAWENRY